MKIFEFHERFIEIYSSLPANVVCIKYYAIKLVLKREKKFGVDGMMALQNLMGLDGIIRNTWPQSLEYKGLFFVSLLEIRFCTIIL
jgi:hypothetical protein